MNMSTRHIHIHSEAEYTILDTIYSYKYIIIIMIIMIPRYTTSDYSYIHAQYDIHIHSTVLRYSTVLVLRYNIYRVQHRVQYRSTVSVPRISSSSPFTTTALVCEAYMVSAAYLHVRSPLTLGTLMPSCWERWRWR